jgi:hypothetical protein
MASPAEQVAATSPAVQGALQTLLHGILTNVAQKFNIAEVDAASGTVVDIEIDKIVLGSAIVGQLVLQNTSLDIAAQRAYLQNVQVIMELDFSFDWRINLGFWSDSGSDSLGSLSIPVDLGSIAVPSLNNIQLNIPSFATNQNVSANIAPLTSVDLGGGAFTGLTATKIAVPANGFKLTGLGIGAVSIASVQVPQTTVAKVTIQDFHPNANILVPSVQLTGIQLPAASAADIQSTAPITFDADASSQGLGLDLGVISGTILVTPIAHISIGSLSLQGVTLSGSVPTATIQNVSVPVDIRGINLSSVSIGQIDVTNITL